MACFCHVLQRICPLLFLGSFFVLFPRTNGPSTKKCIDQLRFPINVSFSPRFFYYEIRLNLEISPLAMVDRNGSNLYHLRNFLMSRQLRISHWKYVFCAYDYINGPGCLQCRWRCDRHTSRLSQFDLRLTSWPQNAINDAFDHRRSADATAGRWHAEQAHDYYQLIPPIKIIAHLSCYWDEINLVSQSKYNPPATTPARFNISVCGGTILSIASLQFRMGHFLPADLWFCVWSFVQCFTFLDLIEFCRIIAKLTWMDAGNGLPVSSYRCQQILVVRIPLVL